MLKILVKEKNEMIEIPQSWNELTEKQYLYICLLFDLLNNKQILVIDFRIMFVLHLFNVKSTKTIEKSKRETIDNNILMLSNQIRFPFLIEYDVNISMFSANLKSKLRKYEPSEIFDIELIDELEKYDIDFYGIDEISKTRKLKGTYLIDLKLTKNHIKSIKIGKEVFQGISFDVLENGLISSDLTAEEFVDAYTYYQAFAQSGNELNLDLLLSTLYRETDIDNLRKKYDSFEAQKNVIKFQNVNKNIKTGVFLFFESMMRFLSNHTYYSLLWGKGKAKNEKSKIDLGIGETILDLVKIYGDSVKCKKIDEYYNILLKERIDGIKLMKEYDKTDNEICEQFNISADQLKKVI